VIRSGLFEVYLEQDFAEGSPPADGLVGSKHLVDQGIVIGTVDAEVKAVGFPVPGNDLDQLLGGFIGF